MRIASSLLVGLTIAVQIGIPIDNGHKINAHGLIHNRPIPPNTSIKDIAIAAMA